MENGEFSILPATARIIDDAAEARRLKRLAKTLRAAQKLVEEWRPPQVFKGLKTYGK